MRGRAFMDTGRLEKLREISAESLLGAIYVCISGKVYMLQIGIIN